MSDLRDIWHTISEITEKPVSPNQLSDMVGTVTYETPTRRDGRFTWRKYPDFGVYVGEIWEHDGHTYGVFCHRPNQISVMLEDDAMKEET